MNGISAIASSARRLVGRLLGAAALCSLAMAANPSAAETVIKFATTMPNNSPMYENVYGPFVRALNEAGKGEFRIDVYEPPFATTTNVWDRVISGVADMGFSILPNTNVPFVRSSVTMVPNIANDTEAGSVALWRLYEKGLLADEFAAVKLINVTALPPVVLITKEPVTEVAQLKGLKIRAVDKNSSDSLAALGASPIAVPFPEAYQALNNGVVDAMLANGSTILAFKFNELANNQIANVHFGMLPSAIYMNRQTYEELSPKGKEVIDRFSGEESSLNIGKAYTILEKNNYEAIAKVNPNYKFNYVTDKQLAEWKEAISRVSDAWVARAENGAEILRVFQEEYAKAGGK